MEFAEELTVTATEHVNKLIAQHNEAADYQFSEWRATATENPDNEEGFSIWSAFNGFGEFMTGVFSSFGLAAFLPLIIVGVVLLVVFG